MGSRAVKGQGVKVMQPRKETIFVGECSDFADPPASPVAIAMKAFDVESDRREMLFQQLEVKLATVIASPVSQPIAPAMFPDSKGDPVSPLTIRFRIMAQQLANGNDWLEALIGAIEL